MAGLAMNDLAQSIRTIPDYPKPGILFRDITTLLGDARAFRRAVDELVQPWAGEKIEKVAGIEARGFILGGAVAHQLSAGFVPVRKKGKLPHVTVSIAYSLEYGVDQMEMHQDAVKPGERVILVDDLIATGGTAVGAVKLLRKLGADVVAACFVIDLPDLGGAKKLAELNVPVRADGVRGALRRSRRGPRSRLQWAASTQTQSERPAARAGRRSRVAFGEPKGSYRWR